MCYAWFYVNKQGVDVLHVWFYVNKPGVDVLHVCVYVKEPGVDVLHVCFYVNEPGVDVLHVWFYVNKPGVNYILSLTSLLVQGEWSNPHTPAALLPQKWTGTHFMAGSVFPRAGV